MRKSSIKFEEFDFFDYTRRIFGLGAGVVNIELITSVSHGPIGVVSDGEMFYGADRDSRQKFQALTIPKLQAEVVRFYQGDETPAPTVPTMEDKKKDRLSNLKESMMIDTIRDFQKALAQGPYAFPGGYPVYFITADGGVLSHESAVEEKADIEEAIHTDDRASGWRVVAMEINYEDSDLYCDHSGERIPSAYAESIDEKKKECDKPKKEDDDEEPEVDEKKKKKKEVDDEPEVDEKKKKESRKQEGYFDPMFYGTDNYYKAPLSPMKYTDSVKHFADKYQAHWVVDLISSYFRQLAKYDFLICTIDLDNEGGAIFSAREDTGRKPVVTQEIEYTDLKVSVKLYLIDGILLFPSDY